MSAAKQKGTAWETALVKHLGAFFEGRWGLAPRRVAQEGFNDSGDIQGISPFVAQAKNYKSWEEAIRLGLDGVEKQKLHAGEPFGVAFVKRVRRSVGAGYAVMTVETFTRLLARLKSAEAHLERGGPGAWTAYKAEAAQIADRDFPKI